MNAALKRALVTGASSGIGESISRRLMGLGWEVIGVARQSGIEKPSKCTHLLQQDLSRLEELADFFKRVMVDYGPIDAVIGCAGQGSFGSLEETRYNDISALINLNLVSQIYLAKAFIAKFKQQRRGDLIFIGSEAAHEAGRKGSVYCASKFGLRGFAKALRMDTGNRGVRISIINPGMVESPFYDDLDFKPGEEQSQHLSVEDVADAVQMVITAPVTTVFDEINLSALNKVIDFKK
ncbi:MAG: 3-hydroxy acid dehydrogenase/malonic semialdehyde reductase [Parasphingorhabdus sp.]